MPSLASSLRPRLCPVAALALSLTAAHAESGWVRLPQTLANNSSQGWTARSQAPAGLKLEFLGAAPSPKGNAAVEPTTSTRVECGQSCDLYFHSQMAHLAGTVEILLTDDAGTVQAAVELEVDGDPSGTSIGSIIESTGESHLAKGAITRSRDGRVIRLEDAAPAARATETKAAGPVPAPTPLDGQEAEAESPLVSLYAHFGQLARSGAAGPLR
jgi:hypothetical protein